MIRGIDRTVIFRNDEDRESFLDRLGGILMGSSTPCYAWSLLSNHAHFLFRTGKIPIARVMRKLLTGYAVTFNRRYRRHGHLFQNRYKSILCEEDVYLQELVRYIHLNPLRAGVVHDLRELGSYAYSGHSVLVGKKKRSCRIEIAFCDISDKLRGRPRRSMYRMFRRGSGKREDRN